MMVKLLITFENVRTDEGSYSKKSLLGMHDMEFFSATIKKLTISYFLCLKQIR